MQWYFQSGDPLNPRNYRPISLLSIIGKLYAKHLLNKLAASEEQMTITGPEQVGFRKGKSILDHCFTLVHQINKYVKQAKTKLYITFLDLRGAFDTVDREKLWNKLANLSIDRRLIFLIKRLYSTTS